MSSKSTSRSPHEWIVSFFEIGSATSNTKFLITFLSGFNLKKKKIKITHDYLFLTAFALNTSNF